jgi:hypothetical protein
MFMFQACCLWLENWLPDGRRLQTRRVCLHSAVFFISFQHYGTLAWQKLIRLSHCWIKNHYTDWSAAPIAAPSQSLGRDGAAKTPDCGRGPKIQALIENDEHAILDIGTSNEFRLGAIFVERIPSQWPDLLYGRQLP